MLAWTPWSPLSLSHPFTRETLAETLDGGQAFRWDGLPPEDCWQGIWGQHIARIRFSGKDEVQYARPTSRPDTDEALAAYLRLDFDWSAAIDSLPWRSDAHLATSLAAYPGLRILKQPFPEAVLCFLCSATKQIPQIKVMCNRMAENFGNELFPGIHALPTWAQLAAASEVELRSLGLGFRAKNIKKTADLLASQPDLLTQIEAAPYRAARELLVTLPGIGEKIADCALLFGAAKLEAFPVDTWIIKVLEKRYHLAGWSPSQLSQFGRIHYGPLAGFAQQFIFSYERQNPK